MSKSCCNNKSLISRDGTSQQQRILKALLPGYVAVDERNIEDLKSFVINYAKEIKFYNNKNEEDINWENFFESKTIDEKNKLTDPHYALFYTFLKLFKYAQNDLNKITKKHIDFFYRDVLQLEERKAVSDQAFIIFELAKHVSSFMIKKGTKLNAGKDAIGKELIYEVDKDFVINKAQVKELKSLFTDKKTDETTGGLSKLSLYASPISNSSDGEGTELDTDDLSWRTFGDTDPENPDRKLANIGFAFASPILHLSEGDRIVTITLKVDNKKKLSVLSSFPEIDKAFRIMFSGESEWLESIYEESTWAANELPGCIENEILEFINNAQEPEDIAGTEPQEGPVYDDPTKGYGDQIDDYDIGKTVAGRIITERGKLDPPKYTSAKQLLNIFGFGQDKLDDLIYSFRRNYHYTIIDPVNGYIIIRRTLDRTQDAVVGYNKENLLDPFSTTYPVAKILLNRKSTLYSDVYAQLSGLKISSAKINVSVIDMTSLILQNDNSMLDPSKPVNLFTNQPIKGSTFYIGNWEVFQKKPDYFHLKYSWVDLPKDDNGFSEYFLHYIDKTTDLNRSNQDFTIKTSYLEDKKWKVINASSCLFTDDYGDAIGDTDKLPDNDKVVMLKLLEEGHTNDISRDIDVDEFDRYDNSLLRGFIKVQLSGMDFGHGAYQLSYTQAIINGISVVNGNSSLDINSIPNQPYTPAISNIKLDYSSTVELNFNNLPKKVDETVSDQFFLIHPFGVQEITNSKGSYQIVPLYDDEGFLFIGVEDLKVPQSLSLLFKMAEGSANPQSNDLPEIKLSYLLDNSWYEFSNIQIQGDSTENFIVSGIISLAVPKTAKSDNTILTSGLHWIKVACSANSVAVPDLIDIKSQAVTAIFKDNGNDPNHLAIALEGGIIKKLKLSESSVKSLSQPYESFGGKTKEQSNNFYKRTSERLRHKNRAITIWDYERLILEEFNNVYKVKCLNHTTVDPFNSISPGNISIIVVPDVKNRTDIDLLRPDANQGVLNKIGDFIKKINSPSSIVHVHNPLYEEIKMSFHVSFLAEDVGFYLTKLNEDLKKFLAPWAYNTDSDVIFGGKLHKSVILNFVEELDYVDYVQSFKMYKSKSSDKPSVFGEDINEAIASSSASILTSVAKHEIKAIEVEYYESDDNITDSRIYGEIKDCVDK